MLIGPKKYVTRLIEYEFEITKDTAAAMRWQHGSNQQPLLANFSVACRGLHEDKWTPYLRSITINGQSETVPAEYGEDGTATADCTADTADGAADSLCLKYLRLR